MAALPVTRAFSADDADPWFDEQAKKERVASEDDDSSKASLRKRSPQALYAALMAKERELPTDSLNKRISILQEAIAAAPKLSGEAQQKLGELQETKAKALNALSAAGADPSLSHGIDVLAPFAPFYAADSELRTALNESTFGQRIASETRSLATSGDLQKLDTIQTQLVKTGLAGLMGERSGSALREVLATLIEEKWSAGLNGSTPLPGERHLIGQILDQPSGKLVMKLDFEKADSNDAANKVEQSLQRIWNKNFEISHSIPDQAADLKLKIDLSSATVSKNEFVENVSSTIPGRITETPNPDFMTAVERYKKAASRYESAMKAYELQYANYLDNMQGQNTAANSGLQSAQASVDAARNQGGAGQQGPGPLSGTANESLKIAEAVALTTSSSPLPEPIKPYPTHLNILDTIYSTPSTTIVAEDPVPYVYTSKKFNYTFNARIGIELSSHVATPVSATSTIDLVRERSWTQNVGTNAKDPTVNSGDFSQDELDSAQSLFNLEVGAACAKRLDELLANAKAALETKARSQQDLGAIVLSLSLNTLDTKSAAIALSDAELQALAGLARNTDLSSAEFRQECLYQAIRKSNFADSLTKEQLHKLL